MKTGKLGALIVVATIGLIGTAAKAEIGHALFTMENGKRASTSYDVKVEWGNNPLYEDKASVRGRVNVPILEENEIKYVLCEFFYDQLLDGEPSSMEKCLFSEPIDLAFKVTVDRADEELGQTGDKVTIEFFDDVIWELGISMNAGTLKVTLNNGSL